MQGNARAAKTGIQQVWSSRLFFVKVITENGASSVSMHMKKAYYKTTIEELSLILDNKVIKLNYISEKIDEKESIFCKEEQYATELRPSSCLLAKEGNAIIVGVDLNSDSFSSLSIDKMEGKGLIRVSTCVTNGFNNKECPLHKRIVDSCLFVHFIDQNNHPFIELNINNNAICEIIIKGYTKELSEEVINRVSANFSEELGYIVIKEIYGTDNYPIIKLTIQRKK